MRNAPEENDPLDLLLREHNPPVEDAGFTKRVMAALPRRRRGFPFRRALLLGLSAAGFALALRWLPWTELPPPVISGPLALQLQVLSPWLPVAAVMASLVWTVLSAIQPED